MRTARQYTLLHHSDCIPPHGLDLSPGSRDSLKVEMLEDFFRKNGFDKTKPALVGYPLNGKIQLLSGTHRHEAAKRADILLPVAIRLSSIVEAAWGTLEWDNLIKDTPVNDLECAEIINNMPPGIDERVNLSSDYSE